MGGLFTSAAYLQALETSGCAAPRSGWTPLHLQLGSARAPCYAKSHSWGEFVFDFEFAAAYEQRGLAYYPKLVCCVPFTPVPGPRLLAADASGRRRLAQHLMEQTAPVRYSGAHVLFLPPAELAELEPLGWLPRRQLRYVWRNTGYTSFEEFLARLASKKRKNIRREREALADAGIEIGWRAAGEISQAQWPRLYELYASTYRVRGQQPYLNLACLKSWAREFPQAMRFCLARRAGELLAMAFYFQDGDALYGRHWGAAEHYDGLHFELCYYQGIEHAIARRLRLFDAGVQGEHRLLRGFEPEFSYSAHWFADAGFRAAIARYLERERAALDAQMALALRHRAWREADGVKTNDAGAAAAEAAALVAPGSVDCPD